MADTVDFSRMTEYEEDAEIVEGKINNLAKLIMGANYVVFFTGAGVSTSSGVPDYRSPTGVWTMRAKGTVIYLAPYSRIAFLLKIY